MKARLESGKIVKYNTIPKAIRTNNGEPVLKANTLTDDSLKQLGFYPIIEPDYDHRIQSLGSLSFNNAYEHPEFNAETEIPQEAFVYDIVDKDLGNIVELKNNKIYELKTEANLKLSKTDWIIVRNSEKGTAIPDEISTKRDAIRSVVEKKETAINALTDKKAVATFDISL